MALCRLPSDAQRHRRSKQNSVDYRTEGCNSTISAWKIIYFVFIYLLRVRQQLRLLYCSKLREIPVNAP